MSRPIALALVAILVAACGGGPMLAAADPAAVRPATPPAATTAPARPPDPLPISLPADDAPHDRLTEWWYYTGHLTGTVDDVGVASDGPPSRYGFEFVIFRAERGAMATTWASHLAITDETGQRFAYAQRAEVGPGVDRTPVDDDGTPAGFDLAIAGMDPADPTGPHRTPWTMAGSDGVDHLAAAMTPAEAALAGVPAGLALDLDLRAAKPAVLHDGDGWIDFGDAGGSYYVSRTSMRATGSLVVDGIEQSVSGTAWFDHQWGDFVAVGGGGWDWFAVNLADGTDLMLSLVRDADGSYPLVYGTLVGRDGTVRTLDRGASTVTVTDRWTSPDTGADYPAGWTVEVPDEHLTIGLRPTVADQELDTRATTGVVYWEGSQVVEATRDGIPIGGEAYVELTGYGPAGSSRP